MTYSFFKSTEERSLWIKLKAEFIQEFQKRVNHQEVKLGEINIPYCPMWVANNQLKYDEENGELRISLEQLLTYKYEDYEKDLREQHKRWLENSGLTKIF